MRRMGESAIEQCEAAASSAAKHRRVLSKAASVAKRRRAQHLRIERSLCSALAERDSLFLTFDSLTNSFLNSLLIQHLQFELLFKCQDSITRPSSSWKWLPMLKKTAIVKQLDCLK